MPRPAKRATRKPRAEARPLVMTTTEARHLFGSPHARRLAAESAAAQQVRTGDRLRYALTITSNHYDVTGSGAFDVDITESLDEPFEKQHMLWSLNAVEGPWVQTDSGGALRWLPVVIADFESLTTVRTFVNLMFAHLIPA